MQTRIPCQASDYYLETLDDEILLYHPARTTIFRLDQAGALIWQLCDGRRSVTDIAVLLQEAYPEARDEIDHDVRALLDRLAQYGIIQFV